MPTVGPFISGSNQIAPSTTNWDPWAWASTHTYQPTVCTGETHVFPCPHCDKCKCGQATVKRAKKGKA